MILLSSPIILYDYEYKFISLQFDLCIYFFFPQISLMLCSFLCPYAPLGPRGNSMPHLFISLQNYTHWSRAHADRVAINRVHTIDLKSQPQILNLKKRKQKVKQIGVCWLRK